MEKVKVLAELVDFVTYISKIRVDKKFILIFQILVTSFPLSLIYKI